MDEMKIHVVNFNKFKDGEPVDGWFNLPVSVDSIKDSIGNHKEPDRFEIVEYDVPFEVSLNESVEQMNELARMALDLGYPLNELIDELRSYYRNVREVYEHRDELCCYVGIDMTELAKEFVSKDYWGELPEFIMPCIDYAALGSRLWLEGTETLGFIKTHLGVVTYRK